MLNSLAGVTILHVPYRGAAAALTDTMSGQVQLYYASMPSVVQHVRAGAVRAIAVTSATRSDALREVPTIAESGFPGFDVNPWFGILAPAGTDMAIVRKINSDVESVLRTPEMIGFLATQGGEPLITSPEKFIEMLQADIAKWAKVVKSANVSLD